MYIILLHSRCKCKQIGPDLIKNMEGGAVVLSEMAVVMVIGLLMMMTPGMRLQ